LIIIYTLIYSLYLRCFANTWVSHCDRFDLLNISYNITR